MLFRKFQIILVPILLLGLISYSKATKNSNMKTWNGNVIDKLGIYNIEEEKYTITVFKDKDSILHYSVSNELGENIIESTERASILHRWCLFWDKNNRLWVWSSDIGGFLWEKDDRGCYKEINIINKEHFIEMPIEVFHFLPSSLRNKLKSDGIVRE